MITYVPSHIVAREAQGGVPLGWHPMDYLPLYEHFARKLLAWKLPHAILVDTSGRGFSDFDPLPSQSAVATVLAKTFAETGTDTPRGAFLKRCGIRRWADLEKPIRLRGRQAKAPLYYDVCERRLSAAPNRYHPGAVYAQSTYFQFGSWKRKWRFVLRYGYSRDASSWQVAVRQQKEGLSTFVNRTVPEWLDEVLEPEEWARQRQWRNREHAELTTAVDTVFGWEYFGKVKPTCSTDALVAALLDGRRPRLTQRRLGVLRGWMAADAAKEAAYLASKKEKG